MSEQVYRERLRSLRKQLRDNALHGYIQPVHDKFQNEYVPEVWRRVEFISGFTGSSGYVIAGMEKAALFVDGRYTLQAAMEVDATQFEIINIADMELQDWLAELPCDSESKIIIGYDPLLFTKKQLERLRHEKVVLKPCKNLVDAVWDEKPEEPKSRVVNYPMRYAGKSYAEKLEIIKGQPERSDLRQRVGGKPKAGGCAPLNIEKDIPLKLLPQNNSSVAGGIAGYFLVTAPDSFCWLFNLRGADTPNTPFVLAYALVNMNNGKSTIFLDEDRLSQDVKSMFAMDIQFMPESALEGELKKVSASGATVLLDAESAPVWFFNFINNNGGKAISGVDPCKLPKACKNTIEIDAIRHAHAIDGAALTKFLHWIKSESLKRPVGEIEASEKLLEFRNKSHEFKGVSFDTISAFGANGAIVHYRPAAATSGFIQPDGVYLLDSGGQYECGTTDVTRTIAIGKPTAEQKRNFTMVLKGHIALANAAFPEGTTGSQLDALARQFLWAAGLDYDHGTGHGVGCYLSVHEGPQRISKSPSTVPLLPGMVISNEPGYYKTGEYGIRIENLVLVVEAGFTETGKKLLKFDTLTLAPIDTDMVDFCLLNDTEKEWLSGYNQAALLNAEKLA